MKVRLSISQMSFKPFDPGSFPNDGVSFPVFARKVDWVKGSHVSSDLTSGRTGLYN